MPTLRVMHGHLLSIATAGVFLAACGDPGGGNVFGNAGSGGSGSDVTTLFAGAGGAGDGGAAQVASQNASSGSLSSPSSQVASSGQGPQGTSVVASTGVSTASGGCPDGSYVCLSGGDCIPTEWQCDGFADCADGSDEAPLNLACGAVSSVASSSASTGGCEIPCGGDPECVLPSDICDGQNDCSNQSDERGCSVGEWTCPENYYGSGDGCDCGCGTRDPDCVSALASACEFCGEGSCADGGAQCEGVRADQNWRCGG